MSSKFHSLPIPPLILKGIDKLGFETCTPIQEKTLPLTLEGQDVAGQAQTGTGKTAAFLIALYTRLLTKNPEPISKRASPRALIIAPTRELAVQIYDEAKVIGYATDFSLLAVYGGVDYEKQRTELGEGIDILVGTPGRLIDYFKQKVYDLRRIDVIIIDEADRMFDMGFIADLRYLLRRLPPFERRQSMLFSATLSHRVMEMAYEHMNNPVKVEVTPTQVTAEKIEQILFHVERGKKLALFLGLLKRESWERILIFVNTKHQGETLARRLTEQSYPAKAITGDLPQKKRLRFLEQFKKGELAILVATDVASRGLHIDGVDIVVNYDFPQDREAYVHRIGRTARAGAFGKAISLADEEYVMSLEEVEKYIGQKIPVEWPEDELFIKPKYVPRPKTPQQKHPKSKTPQKHNRPNQNAITKSKHRHSAVKKGK